MAITYNPYLARPQLDQWNLENGYNYAPGQSWDNLVSFAKQRQSQLGSSANIGDQWNPNSFNMGFGGRLAQVNLGDGGDWNGANFYTITQNTPSGHYMSRLYRNADGSIGEQFVRKNEGFPVEAALVLAAPFAAAAMGAGAAGAGAAGAAEAGAAAGAASSGAGAAAGAGAAGAGTAGAAGAGWISAEGGIGYLGGMADFGALSGNIATSVGAASLGGSAAGGASGAGTAAAAAETSGLGGLISKAGGALSNLGVSDWLSIGNAVAGLYTSNKAANALQDGAAAATAEQRRQFDLTRADMQPWMDAGKNALAKLVNGFDIKTDPSYQFRLAEGEKGIQRMAAANGGTDSGAIMKALSRYNQDLASQEYGTQYNRLASLAGVGQTATNNMASIGADTAARVGNNMLAGSSARASGYVGSANALSGSLGQWYSNNQSNKFLEALKAASGNRGVSAAGYGSGGTFDANAWEDYL